MFCSHWQSTPPVSSFRPKRPGTKQKSHQSGVLSPGMGQKNVETKACDGLWDAAPLAREEGTVIGLPAVRTKKACFHRPLLIRYTSADAVQQASERNPVLSRWATVAAVRASCQAGVHDPNRPGLPWGRHRFSPSQPLSQTSQGSTCIVNIP